MALFNQLLKGQASHESPPIASPLAGRFAYSDEFINEIGALPCGATHGPSPAQRHVRRCGHPCDAPPGGEDGEDAAVEIAHRSGYCQLDTRAVLCAMLPRAASGGGRCAMMMATCLTCGRGGSRA